MKKCGLIKEARDSILCIFCAHKFGQTSKASYIPRRYFTSTYLAFQRPTKSNDDPFASNNDSSEATWGLTPDAHHKTDKNSKNQRELDEFSSGWGSADDAPCWAAPFVEEFEVKKQAAQNVNPLETSNFTENSLKSVFDKDRPPAVRQLNLPPFPGPQSSRAGRPIPIIRPLIKKVVQKDNDYQRLNDYQRQTRKKNSAQEPTEIHLGQRNFNESQTRESELDYKWNLLKRRKDSPVSYLNAVPSHNPEVDKERLERKLNFQSLAADRRKREQEAQLGKYTPLSNFPIFKRIYPQSTQVQEKTKKPIVGNLKENTRSWQDPFDATKINETGHNQGSKKKAEIQAENKVTSEDKSIQKSYSSKLQEYSDLNGKEDDKYSTDSNQGRTDIDTTQQTYGQTILRPILVENWKEIPSKPLDTTKYFPVLAKTSLDPKISNESNAIQPNVTLEEEHEDSAKTKRKKEKKKRGIESRPLYEDEKSRLAGKDRDRARRDARFARDQEEQKEAQLRAREKMERNRQKAEKKLARKVAPTPILLPEFITVTNLAMAMKIRYDDLATKMKQLGFEETQPDFILNSENSGLIAMEYNYEPIPDKTEDMDLKSKDPHPNPTELPPRPPIVTIMGHVDHGKTTLLDYLRKSSVAASEHGGITQHIGAFSVRMPSGKMITFLDTPGHAAFLNMRQRGAFVTDIVILVVAADDGVKPQTLEAIKHARAARVPMIVAINKIDKPGVDIEKVKLELARHGLEIEDFGGDTQVVCVSGQTGEGIDKFEETVMALAEIIDMRAEVDCATEGWVLEASVKALGKVATILVRRGTLRPGQVIVAGTTWARVRVLRNEAGIEVPEAGPGIPVEVDGWRDQPIAGDEALQAEDEIKAKRVIDYRIEKKERENLIADMKAINRAREELRQQKALAKVALEMEEDKKNGKSHDLVPDILKAKAKSKGPTQVYFIIKADVSGSVEAVTDQISLLKTKEVEAVILRSGVGRVSKFDIEHAAAAKGYVASFNLSVDPEIYSFAEESKVRIFENSIIYALVDSIREELSNYLPPLVSQVVLGEAEIAQIYLINFKGRKRDPIAGCKIRNGLIKRSGKIRVIRNGQKVFDGEISSLKTGKKDVQEVSKGNECGLAFAGAWSEFKVGDLIQYYEERREKRFL